MKRKISDKLNEWFNSDRQKVLWLYGAPLTGKTWLALDFARESFGDFFYLNYADDAV